MVQCFVHIYLCRDLCMIIFVFPHVPITHIHCCCFVIPASKLQFESLLWLLEFHAPLFALCMGSWWLRTIIAQSLHRDLYQCMSSSDAQHEVMLSTSIQMLKEGLSCPCSAINIVPGEDGHWARNERAETPCVTLEPLSWDSVYKAPWCSEKNGWTASWGGTWWGRQTFERSVSL